MASSSSSSPDRLSNDKGNYGSILWWQQPSQCSTDAATKDRMGGSYQSIKANESCASLEVGAESFYEDSKGAAARRRLIMFVGLAVIAFFAVAAFGFFGRKPSNGADVIPFPGTKRRAFSALHPVHDLGISPFARPEDSRPPKALTKGAETTDSQSFPTNAWYQNMLLVRGEPTAVNRAYATPFLVDAVGPIPGLRVIPNHVDASTAVVQLNTIDEYGLTVGAAPDATLTDANKSKKDSNSTYSNEYSVDNMTPLGLTLAWVSSVYFCDHTFFSAVV